jgi:hypothetical protein
LPRHASPQRPCWRWVRSCRCECVAGDCPPPPRGGGPHRPRPMPATDLAACAGDQPPRALAFSRREGSSQVVGAFEPCIVRRSFSFRVRGPKAQLHTACDYPACMLARPSPQMGSLWLSGHLPSPDAAAGLTKDSIPHGCCQPPPRLRLGVGMEQGCCCSAKCCLAFFWMQVARHAPPTCLPVTIFPRYVGPFAALPGLAEATRSMIHASVQRASSSKWNACVSTRWRCAKIEAYN